MRWIIAVIAGVIVSQIATFATTIYLHRCQTHGAFRLHPGIEWLFRFFVWITTGQSTKEWVAVHRKHHAFSDELGDPHSPGLEGFWKVQLLNFRLYVAETKNPQTLEKYARDIDESGWWDRYVFKIGALGPMVGIAILCLTLGILPGLLAALTHVLIYVGVLTSCVNAIGHQNVVSGRQVPGAYQNYTRQDASNTFNYGWLAWITGGEGLHNNHHGQPQSAKFSHTVSEPDPGWQVIRFLQRLGLASHVRLPKQL